MKRLHHVRRIDTVVNYTNILRSAFAPIFFPQKITNPNCKHLKALKYEKVVRKMLVKLTPGQRMEAVGQCLGRVSRGRRGQGRYCRREAANAAG
jgi:hypothetical protein